MENIISVLQQIFMGKEDTSIKIGLSEYKREVKPLAKNYTMKKNPPKELRISELMRKESC